MVREAIADALIEPGREGVRNETAYKRGARAEVLAT